MKVLKKISVENLDSLSNTEMSKMKGGVGIASPPDKIAYKPIEPVPYIPIVTRSFSI